VTDQEIVESFARGGAAARSALADRITVGMRAGVFPENSAALGRLIGGVVQVRTTDIALDLAGAQAAATTPDDPWAEEGFNLLGAAGGGDRRWDDRDGAQQHRRKGPEDAARGHARQEPAVP